MNAAFRFLALLALGLALLPAQADQPSNFGASGSLDLAIDFPSGSPKHFTLPYHSGMTVFDAMTEAQGQPRGIHFAYQGARRDLSTLLLVTIDGVTNEGGGAGRRNWTYRVNSILGDRSFGVCKIAADAHVVWQFDTFHPNESMKRGACQ